MNLNFQHETCFLQAIIKCVFFLSLQLNSVRLADMKSILWKNKHKRKKTCLITEMLWSEWSQTNNGDIFVVHLCQILGMSPMFVKCYIQCWILNGHVWLACGHWLCLENVCVWQTRVNSTLLPFNKCSPWKEQKKKKLGHTQITTRTP